MAKRIRWTFNPQFRVDVMLAILNGSQLMAEICRQHGLEPELVCLGKKTLPSRLPTVFDEPSASAEDSTRVADLEWVVVPRP